MPSKWVCYCRLPAVAHRIDRSPARGKAITPDELLPKGIFHGHARYIPGYPLRCSNA